MFDVMPIHPGEVLAEEFMKPYALTTDRLAAAVDMSTDRITDIISGRKPITGSLAILLGRVFGTSAEFWVNLQMRYDQQYCDRVNEF